MCFDSSVLLFQRFVPPTEPSLSLLVAHRLVVHSCLLVSGLMLLLRVSTPTEEGL